ncbi:MAG: phosphoenolpyruvate carboxylase [Janthinobacterium lividum]
MAALYAVGTDPAGPEQDDVSVLLALMAEMRARAVQDPFGNPVLAAALAISRRIDDRSLDEAAVAAVVGRLRDAAAADRAQRLAAYVGGTDASASHAALARLATSLLRPDPADSPLPLRQVRDLVERPRYACVFTAHPTFAAAADTYAALADGAESGHFAPTGRSHRPDKPALADEFDASVAAIANGRDAIDTVCGALLDAARDAFPHAWTTLNPAPVILASWVGLDTDGRTDIGWWDSLRYRLQMKRLGLVRLLAGIEGIEAATLTARLSEAIATVERQLALAPAGPDPDQVEPFARALIEGRERALLSPEPLLPLFAAAIAGGDGAEAGEDDRRRLCVARAGMLSHGLSLAHAHVRLNAAQLHNAARLRLGLDDPPADRSRRRSLLAAMDEALAAAVPLPIDFGALIAEQASAARLMMLVAQVAKHVDRHTRVRFLVAETESGYSLLVALWLARICGAEAHVEISPLFETPDALEDGVRVIEEALRSPHYRAYVRQLGRVCLQFGYSDSGRYLGQLSASYLVERLKLRLVEALGRHGLGDVEAVLFDTHGESIGRGAHPGSLADRFAYLSPPAARAALMQGGLRIREESSFQGGDGYLLFATPNLALATLTRVMEHVYQPTPGQDAIYAEGDFAAGFFATAGTALKDLVEDPGYAALLGAFGPALLDPTGSRPSARQTDAGGPVAIRHPRELRAIPNNAILQQLGWCANVLHGIGAAARRDPELFAGLRAESPRFRRALDLVVHAARHSDLDVLRATVSTLDPASWLDRAAHASRPGRAEQLARVAAALESLGLWQTVQPTIRRAQADQLSLRVAWPELPRMADRQSLLHALRLAVISRIWLLATEVPDFSPRFGATPETLRARLLRLDVPAALDLLAEIFPREAASGAARDYGEPGGAGGTSSYAAEHERIFEPMRRLFGLVREITVALSHEVGAFG